MSCYDCESAYASLLNRSACLGTRVLGVLSMLACFMSSRAHMSYMLPVLKYFACLDVCMLGILVCPTFLTFEKLSSKNVYKENFAFIQTSI